MPRPPVLPTTFDAWLGAAIDGLARAVGGRAMLQRITGLSEKSIARRVRGETPFMTSEVAIIAAEFNMTSDEIVKMALRNYGKGDIDAGFQKLLSEVPSTLDDLATRRLQKEAKGKSPAEIAEDAIAAQAPDPELGTDQPPSP